MLPVGQLLVVLTLSLGAAPDHADALLAGVKSIGATGSPGPVVVFGDHAWPLLVGNADKSAAPVAACATLDRGRLVILGHNGYVLDPGSVGGDTPRLLENAARWVAGSDKPLGIVRAPKLAAMLRRRALEVIELDPRAVATRLNEVSALLGNVGLVTEQNREAVEQFVRAGGGLVTGVPGWGWLQVHDGKSLDDMPAQRLLSLAGLAFADGHVSARDGRYVPADDNSPLLNASRALDAVLSGKAMGKDDALLAGASLVRAAASLPGDDAILRPRLQALLNAGLTRLPDAKKPLGAGDVRDRLVLTMQTREAAARAPGQLVAHPAAAKFPGSVPAKAPRISRTVSIRRSIPGRHSTGLYAAPAERVRVTLPGDADANGLRLRIGAHSDRLWHLDSWKRAPQIDRVFPLAPGQTVVANAFGGPIYVESDGNSDARIDVRIDGAVEAPLFVLDQTDADAWRRQREAPAPWAELAGKKVILTVPSEQVRTLDDPASLMRFWDEVADACADLAALPRERKRPERYVTGVQISAGYMHAGYPIMTHLDAAPRFVDLPSLRSRGDWGMFHEIGHNHQSDDWTFAGTGEVTVNLFTMYILETVCRTGKMHGAITPDAMRKYIERFEREGRSFDLWKRDPFLALVMYRQMIDAFGWEPLKRVFAEYRALPPGERPKTDDGKRGQWLVRMSRATGRNLGPFFERWSIPTSVSAREQVSDLPVWLPE